MKKIIFLVLAFTIVTNLFSNGTNESVKSDEVKTVTIWMELNPNISVSVTSLAETPAFKKLMEETGINIEFIHPSGDELESFNLMVASGDLPDIIFFDWQKYPGGPGKALSDGVIIELNDILDQHMPNLRARYNEHPEWELAARTDDGINYHIPFIRGDKYLMTFYGPQLRKDWLVELGLESPETMDEWTEVLRAFKSAGKAEFPLTMTKIGSGRSIAGPWGGSGSAFLQAFEVAWNFYRDNEQVHFGPYEDNFKEFLTYFKGWYDEGLVDPDIFVNERKTFDAKILNGEAGAWTSYTGSGIGAYMDANGGEGTFDIAPTKYPVLKKGDTPFMTQLDLPVSGLGMAITSAAKDLEACARLLDYAYGEKGHTLYNFGIEGETFNWTNDFPGYEGEKFAEYTELITKNPNGLTMAQAGSLYSRAFTHGAFIQDKLYMVQYATRQSQRDAIDLWGIGESADHIMPGITPTAEESQELSAIMAEVNTYRQEMVVRFILGIEPLENFGEFKKQLKKMGLEKAIAINQNALNRYNAR